MAQAGAVRFRLRVGRQAGQEVARHAQGQAGQRAFAFQLQQAVLKFKTSGVTHVFPVNMVADLPTFTRIAQAQRFHPRYSVPDDGIIAWQIHGGHVMEVTFKNIEFKDLSK